jgi:transcriptional regulator with GAF, ATPase, and Fis domain
LDEVAELYSEVQAKLLRAVQDGVIEPLGMKRAERVNVRLIAATNQDLRDAVVAGGFRDDLYYRLSVGEVRLPPLRERQSDIPKLAIHFLDEINLRLRKSRRFAPESLVKLQSYSWPGNVRELQNVVHRSALLCRQVEIGATELQLESPTDARYWDSLPEPHEGFSMEEHLKGRRRRLFERALELADGNQSRATRLLGVTPQAVFKFI